MTQSANVDFSTGNGEDFYHFVQWLDKDKHPFVLSGVDANMTIRRSHMGIILLTASMNNGLIRLHDTRPNTLVIHIPSKIMGTLTPGKCVYDLMVDYNNVRYCIAKGNFNIIADVTTDRNKLGYRIVYPNGTIQS